MREEKSGKKGITMKILFFLGSGIYLKDTCSAEMSMAKYLVDAGNEVVVCVATDVCDELKTSDLKIEIIPNMKQGLYKKDVKRILAYDYDVVFASNVEYVHFANRFAHEKGVKSVVQVLDIPEWRLVTKEGQAQWGRLLTMLKVTDTIIANTKETKRILIKLGFAAEKIELIYLGVDPLLGANVLAPKSDDSICCVSRCVFHRSLDLGLYAVSCANIKNQLKIVGPGEDTSRLVQLARMIGLNAAFLGLVSEETKVTAIRQSILGIHPSLCPSIGSMFPLESLACGKPCIVWDTPINHDIYQDYVEYAPVYDVIAFTDMIITFVHSPIYSKERGEKGKKWVLKNRTFITYAAALTEVLSCHS